jgi:hypothetical protein
MSSFSVSFEDNFVLLPPKHQEIWKVLWYFSKTYRNAFPSYEKIAKIAKCCVRTVAAAVKSFQNFGWLKTMRRCYRSSIFYIHEKLLFLNPKDRSVFKRKIESYEEKGRTYEHGGGGVFRGKLHDKLHGIYASRDSIATVRYNVHQTRILKDGKWLSIRPNLQKYAFPIEEKLKIQRCFTEAEIALAAESFDTYKKPKRSPIKLFWWLAKEAKRMFKYGR